jgi:hypothetical protein
MLQKHPDLASQPQVLDRYGGWDWLALLALHGSTTAVVSAGRQ